MGEIKYKNGDKYYGYSLNQRPHGQGIYTNKLGEKFSGEFIHGEITYGTIKFPDGKRYTGDLKNWQPNGNGEMRTDSEKSEGVWKDGMKHGFIT